MEILLFAATAGEASAQQLSVSGGMSFVDGTFITALCTGIASVVTAIGTIMWCGARNKKTVEKYVDRCECEQHRLAISKRIDELGPALQRIFVQIRENDKKSEERSMQMHRRIDPILEKTAANAAELNAIRNIIKEN